MNRLKVILASMLVVSSFVVKSSEFILPSLTLIPAGDFVMGGDKEIESQGIHWPKHKVSVSSFLISKYEVTVKEFKAFVDDTGYKTSDGCWVWTAEVAHHYDYKEGHWLSEFNAPSEFHPVMCIRYYDAQAYVAWLSKKSGYQFRLLAEAEWEYAARAGSTSTYFFGERSSKICEYGNVFDYSGIKAFKRDKDLALRGFNCNDNSEYTAVVGMYKPNGFGLYDMTGNVGEIMQDCEHYGYKGAPTDGSAWVDNCASAGPTDEYTPVIHRGGNYGYPIKYMQIFARGHTGKGNSSSMGEGFRIALDNTEHNRKLLQTPHHSTQSFLKELLVSQQELAKKWQKKEQMRQRMSVFLKPKNTTTIPASE